MEMSRDVARASLDEVQTTMTHVRRSVASAGTDWALIIWGVLWIACYITTHLLIPDQVEWIGLVWTVGVGAGIVGMALLGIAMSRRQRIRSERARTFGWRMFWSWAALAIFADFWLVVFWPWHGLQLNIFLVTLAMLAYILIGLWMEERFFVWLGAGVALAAAGGYLVTVYVGWSYYNLWMAAIGGGGLLGSGIYIRRAWRCA